MNTQYVFPHNFNINEKKNKNDIKDNLQWEIITETQKAKGTMLRWEGKAPPNTSICMLLAIENRTT